MKTGDGHVVQVLIRLHNVIPDQHPQLIYGYPKLVGGLVFGVLSLRRFDSDRCLIHDAYLHSKSEVLCPQSVRGLRLGIGMPDELSY